MGWSKEPSVLSLLFIYSFYLNSFSKRSKQQKCYISKPLCQIRLVPTLTSHLTDIIQVQHLVYLNQASFLSLLFAKKSPNTIPVLLFIPFIYILLIYTVYHVLSCMTMSYISVTILQMCFVSLRNVLFLQIDCDTFRQNSELNGTQV